MTAKAAPLRATTFRLTPENEEGLRLLHAELGRPLNKLVNQAVAEYIEAQSESLERKLEQTLTSLKAYRRRDPGFRKAIEAFAEAEAALDDPAEGHVSSLPEGPALTLVREALRGG
ncbi:hypothetical protein [Piscinibacter sp.]|uniref:hypothetical protein n=1 Tax=Piscinibacter sp. TaxID=1903157 RepID=UPI0039E27F3D